MSRFNRILARAGLALALVAAPASATPADQVQNRVDGLKALGGAFKAVNDALRDDQIQPVPLRQAAQRISNAAREQYGWFPAGSGPDSGARTYARPEVWTKRAAFRLAQDNFAAAARSFEHAVASGNVIALRGEARKLGGTCKACHDQFRAPRD